MNKDDTLHAIVDHYELNIHDNYMICGLNDAWDKSRNECKKILQSTVSSLKKMMLTYTISVSYKVRFLFWNR